MARVPIRTETTQQKNEVMTTITTIEQALDYVEQLQQGKNGDHPITFQFDGELKKLTIELEGPLFHGELTGEVARGLTQLQDEIYRATAFALNGVEGRQSRLSNAQREAVELSIDVDEGCTLINIDLGKLGEGLVKTLTAMDQTQLTILVVASVAVLAVGWIGKTWVSEHYKSKSAEASGEQETARLQAATNANVQIADRMARVIDSSSKIARFAAASENGLTEIATRATSATSMTAGRVELGQDDLANLRRRAPRSTSESINEVGNFRILSADGKSSPFKLTISGDVIPGEFVAEFDESEFSIDQANGVWGAFRNRETVVLEVKAVQIRDKIKAAVITGVRLCDGLDDESKAA